MASLINLFLTILCIYSKPNAALTISTSGNTTVGTQNVGIHIVIDTDTDLVDIIMSGPSDRWFAIGFGSTVMSNTYTISASNTDTVTERLLGDQKTGSVLDTTITVLSDTSNDTVRIVHIQRDRVGSTSEYYTFPTTEGEMDFIWAHDHANPSSSFAYHGSNSDSHGSYIRFYTLFQSVFLVRSIRRFPCFLHFENILI